MTTKCPDPLAPTDAGIGKVERENLTNDYETKDTMRCKRPDSLLPACSHFLKVFHAVHGFDAAFSWRGDLFPDDRTQDGERDFESFVPRQVTDFVITDLPTN